MKKILFVVNTIEFFISHRLPLAVAAKSAGYDVHIAAAASNEINNLQRQGFECHVLPFARSGQNPFRELFTLVNLLKLFRQVKPDLVHLITIKPVLYGGIIARLANVKSVVAAVSGLGTVFVSDTGIVAKLRRQLVTYLYGFAFRHKNLIVIFQNPDDSEILLNLGVVNISQVQMIRGSGVHLVNYRHLPEPSGRPVVVMAARLLKDKGVLEFVESARLLKDRGVDVEMRLIGSPDPGNSTSITQQDLERWEHEGYVHLLGHRKDIAEQYAIANVVCLPSYREGLPKSLIEAAACGRAVVTTDVPGCRDAITPDVTGILVPVKNASALADAIQTLLASVELRQRMGIAGRKLAEDVFTIEKVVGQHMEIYKSILQNG